MIRQAAVAGAARVGHTTESQADHAGVVSPAAIFHGQASRRCGISTPDRYSARDFTRSGTAQKISPPRK
jgi:hypothetical protein